MDLFGGAVQVMLYVQTALFNRDHGCALGLQQLRLCVFARVTRIVATATKADMAAEGGGFREAFKVPACLC